MYSYVTRVLLVCSFSHDHIENHGNAPTRESKFHISLFKWRNYAYLASSYATMETTLVL